MYISGPARAGLRTNDQDQEINTLFRIRRDDAYPDFTDLGSGTLERIDHTDVACQRVWKATGFLAVG
jgi:hypothetical protein